MHSDKPESRPFQDWVTCEGLPAIRKDGVYAMGEEKVRTGGLPRVQSGGDVDMITDVTVAATEMEATSWCQRR
jgi:hypothetical protein